MAHKCSKFVISLSCNTDEAPLPYCGGCLFPKQSKNEIERASEVENKSNLVCTSLSGCVYKLPGPVVIPHQIISTGEF